LVLAKLALYRDSISPRQAVRLTLIKGASAKNMNPNDLTSHKNRRHHIRRLSMVRRQSLLLQRMTSSRQGKPKKEFRKLNSRLSKSSPFYSLIGVYQVTRCF